MPTLLLMAALTALATPHIASLLITLAVDLLVIYLHVSPLFGYVELGESCLIIKFGFFLKREIPYFKIRGPELGRGIVSDSMLSLKCALEHVKVRYNTFDVVTVSVVGNEELAERISALRNLVRGGETKFALTGK